MILLDLNLPDMHGAEVLRRLQEQPETAGIPVVVLSADATPSQIERLLSAGARNYLTKPFDIDPFLALVDEFAVEGSAAGRVWRWWDRPNGALSDRAHRGESHRARVAGRHFCVRPRIGRQWR